MLFASLEILKANRPETSMCEPGPLVLLLARPLENVASAEGALVLFRSHSHGQSFWLAVEIRDFLLLELGVSLLQKLWVVSGKLWGIIFQLDGNLALVQLRLLLLVLRTLLLSLGPALLRCLGSFIVEVVSL